METVCKTLEIPCIKKNSREDENFSMDTYSANIYLNILKILAKVKNREEFQNKMIELYLKQVDLAIKYAKEIFGKYFPPF